MKGTQDQIAGTRAIQYYICTICQTVISSFMSILIYGEILK